MLHATVHGVNLLSVDQQESTKAIATKKAGYGSWTIRIHGQAMPFSLGRCPNDSGPAVEHTEADGAGMVLVALER